MLSKVIKNFSLKSILYGLPLFYFLVAVSFYLGTYDSAQIKITIVQVGGAFLIFSWLVNKLETDLFENLKKNYLVVLPIVLFLLSGIVSYFISPYKLASANELIKRIVYCFSAVIIIDCFQDKKNLERLIKFLICATYIVCIYGVVQFIDTRFFPAPPAKGFDPFIWRWAFDNRIFSTFGNPNFLGDFLVVMNPIVLALFLKKRKFYLLFLWTLICFTTVFSYSKGAWLGFGVGLIVFAFLFAGFVYNAERKKKIILISAMSIATLMIVVGGIVFQLKARPDSSSFRIFTWQSCWEMINTHPVMGTGIGTFYLTYPSYRRPQIFFIEGMHNTESDHPENEYLEVFYDEGLIGLGIFLLILFMVLSVGFKNLAYFKNKKSQDTLMYLQLGFIAALMSQIFHNCVCVSLRFVSSGVMLWMLVGCILATALSCLDKNEEDSEASFNMPVVVKRAIQVLLLVITISAINVFVGFFQADALHAEAIKYSKAKNWDKALELYSKVIEKNKSFIMAYYFKANNFSDRWQNDDPEKALEEYKEIWKLSPNYVQSKFLAGMVYSKLVAYFNNQIAILTNGNNEEALQNAIKNRETCFRMAVYYYNQYKMIDPIFPAVYYNLANLYTISGNYELAEKEYLEHINFPNKLREKPYNFYVENWKKRRMHEYAETCLKLASLEYMLGKKEDSEKVFLETLKYDGTNIDALKSLSMIYRENKNKEMYAEVVKILKEVYPNDESVQKMSDKI